jgi:hypothetical protein
VYVQFLAEHESHFVIPAQGFMSFKSVSFVMYQFSNHDLFSQTTQFDHHSTSVFAINTNHPFCDQFLFVTKYEYPQSTVFKAQSQLTLLFHSGSVGIEDIQAYNSSSLILDTEIHFVAAFIPGRIHLSH